MILKNFEIDKIDLNKTNIILLYGKNNGFKKETINKILKNIEEKPKIYDEREIFENYENFINSLLSKSFFEEKKIIIINRSTDKILKTIEEIRLKNTEDLIIILNSETLEKKSKLRSYFEKNKESICIAFYPDNITTLLKISHNFLKENKISISSSNINHIINRSNQDREGLLNELNKIVLFSKSGKQISDEIIFKLTNLSENHSISELIDCCLLKNEKKTISIINENNFSNEDCILIIRTFLNKLKRVLKLSTEFKKNQNIDLTITTAKPPIFWKDKEITKLQIYKWEPKKIRQLIYQLNEIEMLIKKNINNSVNIIIDFILKNSSQEANN